jgi:hypothetical protein
LDAAYAFRQSWSAGVGLFDIVGDIDAALFGPDPLSGSNNGSPDTRGYTAQFECVPLGKKYSCGRPWVNLRVGLQYRGAGASTAAHPLARTAAGIGTLALKG